MFISNFKYQISNIKFSRNGLHETNYSIDFGNRRAVLKLVPLSLVFKIFNPNGVGL